MKLEFSYKLLGARLYTESAPGGELAVSVSVATAATGRLELPTSFLSWAEGLSGDTFKWLEPFTSFELSTV